MAASWQQEVGNVFKLCRSSACYCGLRVRLQLWFWMKRLASRGCSASAAICSAGNGLRWRAGSLPPKKTTVLWGAMAWGGSAWQSCSCIGSSVVSRAALDIAGYSSGCPSRTKGMPWEALDTRCKPFHSDPSPRRELQE